MDSLTQELEETLVREEVILDLAELTYIDNAGIALLQGVASQASLENATPFIEALLARPSDEGKDR